MARWPMVRRTRFCATTFAPSGWSFRSTLRDNRRHSDVPPAANVCGWTVSGEQERSRRGPLTRSAAHPRLQRQQSQFILRAHEESVFWTVEWDWVGVGVRNKAGLSQRATEVIPGMSSAQFDSRRMDTMEQISDMMSPPH